MLLAGLISTASKWRKFRVGTIADTKLEREVISKSETVGLRDYKPSRPSIARLKLEGRLDVGDYRKITITQSIHPSVGYSEMLKTRNSREGN